MKSFEVQYTSHATIEAEDFEQARKKFLEQFPIPIQATSFYDTETGEKKEVVGTCEISELPIFEDEPFEHDAEGVMWLKKYDGNTGE